MWDFEPQKALVLGLTWPSFPGFLPVTLSPGEGSILCGSMWHEQRRLSWKAGCLCVPHGIFALLLPGLGRLEGWADLCWTSCSRLPSPFLRPTSYFPKP